MNTPRKIKLKGSYKYINVLFAVKFDSKGRLIVNPAPVTIVEEKSSYVPSSNPTPTRELTFEEREERRLRRIAEEAE